MFFATFIERNKDLGWNRIEVLKMLKRNDLLETGSERVYDKKVKINSKTYGLFGTVRRFRGVTRQQGMKAAAARMKDTLEQGNRYYQSICIIRK